MLKHCFSQGISFSVYPHSLLLWGICQKQILAMLSVILRKDHQLDLHELLQLLGFLVWWVYNLWGFHYPGTDCRPIRCHLESQCLHCHHALDAVDPPLQNCPIVKWMGISSAFDEFCIKMLRLPSLTVQISLQLRFNLWTKNVFKTNLMHLRSLQVAPVIWNIWQIHNLEISNERFWKTFRRKTTLLFMQQWQKIASCTSNVKQAKLKFNLHYLF